MKSLQLLLLFFCLVVKASSSESVPTEISLPPGVTIEHQSIGRRSRGLFKTRLQPPPVEQPAKGRRGGSQVFRGKALNKKEKGSGKRKIGALVAQLNPFPSLKEMGGKARVLVETFLEHTLYSKENQPESTRHAEWNGFLSGWMLVAIPVPLPILVAALSMNVVVLKCSKWDDEIKNKYLIGLSHGATVLLVLLRTLENKVGPDYQGVVSPRVAAMGCNLAINLLFGHAGSYGITKRLMDTAISATLLYLLFHYLR